METLNKTQETIVSNKMEKLIFLQLRMYRLLDIVKEECLEQLEEVLESNIIDDKSQFMEDNSLLAKTILISVANKRNFESHEYKEEFDKITEFLKQF